MNTHYYLYYLCVSKVFFFVVFFQIRVFCRNPRLEESKEFLKDTCQFLPDDVGRCVLRSPCKQVIKSRRRAGQGRRCCVSGFIPCPLWDQLTPPALSFPSHLTFNMCFNYLFYYFRLIPMLRFSIRCFSRSLPQEEPQSYLGYAGFDELKSHLTNSVCLCWE